MAQNELAFPMPRIRVQIASKKRSKLLPSFLPLLTPFDLSTASPLIKEATVALTLSSTSAQPRSTKAQGECVVCGKICSTKCAACAGQGLEWMYFCSKTHQELVSPSQDLPFARKADEKRRFVRLFLSLRFGSPTSESAVSMRTLSSGLSSKIESWKSAGMSKTSSSEMM